MGRKPIPQRIRRRFDAAVDTLTSILPPAWTIEVVGRSDAGGMVQATNTSGATGEFDVVVREELDPRAAIALDDPARPTFVFARWLSKRTRTILSDCGFSYGDDTGNISLSLTAPEIYIRLDGATQDPSPKPIKGPNLRGPKAWALLRTLIEVRPPYTVSELPVLQRAHDPTSTVAPEVGREPDPTTGIDDEPVLSWQDQPLERVVLTGDDLPVLGLHSGWEVDWAGFIEINDPG